jgi:predicted RNase H-like nuclease (RuvC/YqgF family)
MKESLEAKLVTVDRDLKEKIRFLEADVQQYTRDIEDLTKARDSKAAQLEELKRQLRSRHNQPSAGASRSATGINYQLDSFDWDRALLKMKKQGRVISQVTERFGTGREAGSVRR